MTKKQLDPHMRWETHRSPMYATAYERFSGGVILGAWHHSRFEAKQARDRGALYMIVCYEKRTKHG